MSFTQDDVTKLAHMARIAVNVDPQNGSAFEHSIAEDLNKILRLVNQISEINTDHISAMDHSLSAAQRCRPDVISEPNVRASMQALVAPSATAAGLYLVPKVVE